MAVQKKACSLSMEEEEENERRIRDIWQAIAIVFTKLEDVEDLASASLVSKEWYEAHCTIRSEATVILKHGATPTKLSARYPNLKVLKIRDRTNDPDSDLVDRRAKPWVNEISIGKFSVLKSIGFKRIIITDLDLDVLSRALGEKMEALV